MACVVAAINRGFVVRWLAPTLADVRHATVALDCAVRDAGRPVIFVGVIPVDSDPPAPATRHALDAALAHACATCESVHFIVEGDGFRHAVLRSILAANILATGRRGMVFVSSDVAGAIARVPPARRLELGAIMTLAAARNLVSMRWTA